ncbi:MAG: response regulator [Casimicrobiaceae bacterium]
MSTAATSSDGGKFGRFEILPAERRLEVDGQSVALGSRAFDLLATLVARRDRVVSKNELIDLVWPGLVVEENNLQVQISALRKVLGANSIATVPGRGYQFTVATLTPGPAPTAAASGSPAAPAASEAPRVRAPEHSDAAMSRPSRLLVADDNKVNRLLLCRSLELMGHEVASADNGRTALEKLRAEHFDLLLLDLEMPEVDGFDLLEQRAVDPALRELPVIVTSSLEGVAQVARCIELGADDYLYKPVNPVLLRARVNSSLERKHLRDRQRELVGRLSPGLGDLPTRAILSAATDPARRAEVTLLVAQVRQIDMLAKSQPVHDTIELLNNWTTLMLDAVEVRGGMVNRVAGDGLTAVFGAPDPVPADGGAPLAAVQAALEMFELVAAFNNERAAAGKAPIGLSVGIASGEVLAGYAGTTRRAAFVCIGAAMQRAAELEALATQHGFPILVDDATQTALAERIVSKPVPAAGLARSAPSVPVHAIRLG